MCDCMKVFCECAMSTGVLYCVLLTFLIIPNLAQWHPSPVPRDPCNSWYFPGNFPNEWIPAFKEKILQMCGVNVQYNCYLQSTAHKYAVMGPHGTANYIQYNMRNQNLSKKYFVENGTEAANESIGNWFKNKQDCMVLPVNMTDFGCSDMSYYPGLMLTRIRHNQGRGDLAFQFAIMPAVHPYAIISFRQFRRTVRLVPLVSPEKAENRAFANTSQNTALSETTEHRLLSRRLENTPVRTRLTCIVCLL
ncbi:unnamed protein product [Cylicocyclus nassatus]|uniref:Uncharacterized protein n=1 Tax=Cylicocyclus nassatus TaxID=53992 RepID=A0AA36MCE0_CYLNA|nr:unnamed protein product [Cylicocyclus nassatus]